MSFPGFDMAVGCWCSPNMVSAPTFDDLARRTGARRTHVAGYLTETITAQVRDLPLRIPIRHQRRFWPPALGCQTKRSRRSKAVLATTRRRAGSANTSAHGCAGWMSTNCHSTATVSKFSDEVQNYTPFTTAGRVQPFVAAQLLRAAQVGGLQDARLEISVYHLLLSLGKRSVLGLELNFRCRRRPRSVLSGDHSRRVGDAPRAGICQVDSSDSAHGFLSLHKATVEELDASDKVLRRTELELCAPRSFGLSTMSVIPVVRLGNQYLVGLERRDLPAVQLHGGTTFDAADVSGVATAQDHPDISRRRGPGFAQPTRPFWRQSAARVSARRQILSIDRRNARSGLSAGRRSRSRNARIVGTGVCTAG